MLLLKLDILKIKDLITKNRDRKMQDIRYYSIDSNRQDNIQLPL